MHVHALSLSHIYTHPCESTCLQTFLTGFNLIDFSLSGFALKYTDSIVLRIQFSICCVNWPFTWKIEFLQILKLQKEGKLGSSCHGSKETNLTSIHEDSVRSLVSFSGLRIWCYPELWCRSKMWLRSGVAVAVV